MIRASLNSLAFGILLVSGFWTLFASHASSLDSRALFWSVLPFAVVHVALTVFFFMRAPVWGKCCLAAYCCLALFSFLDLTVWVWFHLGLLSWLMRSVLSIEL